MMSPKLTDRIDELRRCRNVCEVRVIELHACGHRALVRVWPRTGELGSNGAEWEQPREPFLMLVDTGELVDEHVLH